MMMMNFELYTSRLIKCMVSKRADESGTKYGGKFLLLLLCMLSFNCEISVYKKSIILQKKNHSPEKVSFYRESIILQKKYKSTDK